MTPLHTAVRADQYKISADQLWPNPVQDNANPQRYRWQTSSLNLLQTSLRWAHAGWKWLEQRRSLHVSSRRLRLAETISLGDKRSVSIIEVDGAQYLIGSSAGSVQLLAALDKQQSLDASRGEERAS